MEIIISVRLKYLCYSLLWGIWDAFSDISSFHLPLQDLELQLLFCSTQGTLTAVWVPVSRPNAVTLGLQEMQHRAENTSLKPCSQLLLQVSRPQTTCYQKTFPSLCCLNLARQLTSHFIRSLSLHFFAYKVQHEIETWYSKPVSFWRKLPPVCCRKRE